MTTRWRCAETLQVASGHSYYNTHQIWSQYAEALWRYSLAFVFDMLRSRVIQELFE